MIFHTKQSSERCYDRVGYIYIYVYIHMQNTIILINTAATKKKKLSDEYSYLVVTID